ncbi:hypothetical protein ASC77_06530 [Nocardioides sp. Root1257]|nr:hypothetical protein ASC77_06530 [Nocardioides sp. Root1257]KRC47587.1 hypothetical protein ASE24_06530 [Nocardioides sp. Root224]
MTVGMLRSTARCAVSAITVIRWSRSSRRSRRAAFCTATRPRTAHSRILVNQSNVPPLPNQVADRKAHATAAPATTAVRRAEVSRLATIAEPAKIAISWAGVVIESRTRTASTPNPTTRPRSEPRRGEVTRSSFQAGRPIGDFGVS